MKSVNAWLLAPLLILAGLLHQSTAEAQSLVICNVATAAPCTPTVNPGNGAQGMPAWVAFGTINANFNLLPPSLFTGLPLPVISGGTGQTTLNAALTALLPSQAGQAGNCLGTDGTVASWITCGGGGGSSAFSAITSGINTCCSMVVGTGASISVTGFGTNQATSLTSLTGMPSQAASTVIANVTGAGAVPLAVTLPTFQAAVTAATSQLVVDASPGAGPINDYSPTGYGTTTAILYVTPAGGGTTLNGLVAGSAMQQVFIINAEAAGGADLIKLANQSASDTTAINRFLTSATVSLAIPAGGGVDCIYLASTINRWWCH